MTHSQTSRRLALVGVVALIAALFPFTGAFAQDETNDDALNLEGTDTTEYSIRWSQVTYTPLTGEVMNAPTEALIGRDDLFADSLAGGALQGDAIENGRPLLLTDTDELEDDVLAELDRVLGGDGTVHILGGEVAISAEVEEALADAGYDINRFEGETRIETAAAIAAAKDSDTVLVVRAFPSEGSTDETQAFADSLGAGALAAANDWEILFTQSDTLTENTAAELEAGGYERAIIVGGDQAISEDVANSVGEIVGAENTERVGGGSRVETAIELNGLREDELGSAAIVIDGFAADAWADGFPAANTSGLFDYPVVLVNGDTIPEATEAYLVENFGDEDAAFAAHFTNVALVCGNTVDADTCQALLDAINEDGGGEVKPFPPTEEPEPEPEVNETATTRPELLSATIGELVTTQQATASNPAGLRVTYVFDEPVSQITGAGNFYVWNAAGTLASGALGAGGGTATIGADNTTVTVRFASITSQSAVDNITLASVGYNAVADFQGQQNPEGSAPVGTASDTTTLQAGVTDAPDLLSVGGFRAASGATQTAVDFTFDEAAFVTGAGTGSAGVSDFYLIPVDGTAPYIRCDAPAPGTSTAGGQAAVGGNGTTTITVNCDNNAGATSTTLLSAASIARGAVEQGAVTDATTAPNNANPLQTADISNGGNTTNPDLVAAALQLDASVGGAARDAVVYQFDQAPGTPPVASNFRAYLSNGQEVLPTADAPVVNGNVVTVFYNDAALSNATGASIRVNAVPGDGSPGVLGNDEDEVGVTNGTLAGRTPGLVAGPQLVSASVERATVPLGEGPFQVRYLFDSDVNAAVVNGNFYVYQSNGDRSAASNCTRGGAGANNQVVCTAYAGITNNSNIGSAVLATVDAGAVTDAAGRINPHDAEVLSGSTGTPAE
jgi:putative cell wall-binding protein